MSNADKYKNIILFYAVNFIENVNERMNVSFIQPSAEMSILMEKTICQKKKKKNKINNNHMTYLK